MMSRYSENPKSRKKPYMRYITMLLAIAMSGMPPMIITKIRVVTNTISPMVKQFFSRSFALNLYDTLMGIYMNKNMAKKKQKMKENTIHT